jgi:hypothetical protein
VLVDRAREFEYCVASGMDGASILCFAKAQVVASSVRSCCGILIAVTGEEETRIEANLAESPAQDQGKGVFFVDLAAGCATIAGCAGLSCIGGAVGSRCVFRVGSTERWPLCYLDTCDLCQVADHHRQQRKEAKRHPSRAKKLSKDPGIPNLHPFKAQLMNQVRPCAGFTGSCFRRCSRRRCSARVGFVAFIRRASTLLPSCAHA